MSHDKICPAASEMTWNWIFPPDILDPTFMNLKFNDFQIALKIRDEWDNGTYENKFLYNIAHCVTSLKCLENDERV